MNGDVRRKISLEDDPSVAVLVNGEGGGELNGVNAEGDEGSKSPSGIVMQVSPADRVKRKAKRLTTKVLFKEGPNEATLPVSRYLKNSRKPRNGFGRGLPKKGGAGGKHTWGAYGSEMSVETAAALDYKDPNYDSESLDNGDIHLEAIIPEMSDDEIQKNVESTILEYFEVGDTGEVFSALGDLNFGQKKYQIIVIAVEAAMDHKPSHRELTSVLISELIEEMLETEDVAKAFEVLLQNLPDLILDAPDAATILGNFIARAVADDCISAGFVHSRKDKMENEQAKAALAHAEVLLLDKIAMLRLHNVWGVGGGAQPVKALSRRIHMLLEEFLSSNDATEAARCLQELEVPHFHHEMVYEAILMAIESMSETREDSICRLLKSLYASCLVTPDQMKQGFLRVFDDLPDICIDVPAAYSLIDRFANKALTAGIIMEELVREVPTRGRKRFVSEGDGGKVKEETL